MRAILGIVLLACIACAQSEAMDADALDKQMDALVASGETLMQKWATAEPSDVVPEVEEIQTDEAPITKTDMEYDAIFGHHDTGMKESPEMVAASADFRDAQDKALAEKTARDKKKLAKAKAKAAEKKTKDAAKAVEAHAMAVAKAKRKKAQALQAGIDLAKHLVGDKSVKAYGVSDIDIPALPKKHVSASEQKAAQKSAKKKYEKDGKALAFKLLHPPAKYAPTKAAPPAPKTAKVQATQVSKPKVEVKAAPRPPAPQAVSPIIPSKPPAVMDTKTGIQVVSQEKIHTKHGDRVLPPSVHLPNIHEFPHPPVFTATKMAPVKAKPLPRAVTPAENAPEDKWTDEQWKAHFHAQAINNPIFHDAKVLGYLDEADEDDQDEDEDEDEDADGGVGSMMKFAGMGNFVKDEYKPLSTADLLGN